MDIRKIKEIALEYRALLIKKHIQPDIIILFGSNAKGMARPDSDIDVAIVSRQFDRNKPKYSLLLNRLTFEIEAPLEVIPVGYSEYMQKSTVSPILHEIIKTGVILF